MKLFCFEDEFETYRLRISENCPRCFSKKCCCNFEQSCWSTTLCLSFNISVLDPIQIIAFELLTFFRSHVYVLNKIFRHTTPLSWGRLIAAPPIILADYTPTKGLYTGRSWGKLKIAVQSYSALIAGLRPHAWEFSKIVPGIAANKAAAILTNLADQPHYVYLLISSFWTPFK